MRGDEASRYEKHYSGSFSESVAYYICMLLIVGVLIVVSMMLKSEADDVVSLEEENWHRIEEQQKEAGIEYTNETNSATIYNTGGENTKTEETNINDN